MSRGVWKLVATSLFVVVILLCIYMAALRNVYQAELACRTWTINYSNHLERRHPAKLSTNRPPNQPPMTPATMPSATSDGLNTASA